MKKIFITMTIMALLLLPLAAFAQSERSSSEAPSVSQALVPEGDFALKLATVLKLGTPANEAQAEEMLTSVGIAPRNGWIADYPVTPDIIGELQDGVASAADSKKLPMEKVEALKAFQDLTTEFGLAVVPGSSDQYAENQPRPDPTIVNNYYYEEGPPVVTYYPPPWDYYYLYGWVPYPFWSGGFFFSGFFCLHDFHRVVFVGHRRCVVSNHVFNRATNTVARVDPVGRRTGEALRTSDISRNRGFNSTEARRGADSIFQRSRERDARMTTDQGSGRSQVRPNTGSRSEQQRFTNRGNNTQPFNSRGERSVSQPSNSERRNDMNSRASSPREGRSSSGPSVTSERSFSSPSAGSRSFRSSESSGRSFSAPARSFSGPSGGSSSTCANCHGGNSSFGRGGGGSSSRGFSGGGSSRGGGSAGGRGGGGRGR